MSVSFVQKTSQASSSTNVGSLQTSAFGSAVTTGNTVLVGVTGFPAALSGNTYSPVSDTEGNTYTLDAAMVFTNATPVDPATTQINEDFVAVFRFSNVTGGSSFKVTVTVGGASPMTSTLVVTAMEISGLSNSAPSGFPSSGGCVDTTSHGNGVSSSHPATGTFSTSNANDLIIIGMLFGGGTTRTITEPAGYTSWNQEAAGATYGFIGDMAYQVVSSTQSSVDPQWTVSSTAGNYYAFAIAYKGSGGGGGASPCVLMPGNMHGDTSPSNGGFSN